MKAAFYYINLILILFLLTPTLNAHPHNPALRPRTLSEFGNITYPSSYFNIRTNGSIIYQVYFDFEDGNITVLIKFNFPNQYFAVGFGDSMTGADIWVFQIDGDEVKASDMYSYSEGRPINDINVEGCQDDLILLGYSIQPDFTLVKFQRLLNTNELCDAVIEEGETSMIWATYPGSPDLIYHDINRGVITGYLITGYQGDAIIEVKDAIGLHGLFMTISWGLLLDIGIFWIRYNKQRKKPPVHLLHMGFMLVTFVLAAAFILTLILYQLQYNGSFLPKGIFSMIHGLIGLGIIFFAFLAVIGGLSTFFGIRNPDGNIKVLQIKKGHKIAGYFIYALTRVNLLLGAIAATNTVGEYPWWIVYIYVVISIFFHAFFSQKVFKKKILYEKLPENDESKTEIHQRLLRYIEEGRSKEEIARELPNLIWVILGEDVLDLTDFVHPGGNFIIHQCIGREIGRFLNGSYFLESSYTILPHVHSPDAMRIIESSTIGKIKGVESVVVEKRTRRESVIKEKLWQMVGKSEISPQLSRFDFMTKDFEMKHIGVTTTWFGRHFSVRTKNSHQMQSRLYTTVLALTEESRSYREAIMSVLKHPNEFSLEHVEFPQARQSLPLFIKKYSSAKMPLGLSKVIHETVPKFDSYDDSNLFKIEGPLGRGLELGREIKGTYVILCAGTGILPFLDFLNYTFLRIAHLILKTSKPECASNLEKIGLDFEPNIEYRIKFYGNFKNTEETYGIDILQKLADINHENQLSIFEAKLPTLESPYIEQIRERIDKKYIKKFVDLKAGKYLICGPPAFNREIPEILQGLKVPASKICLV